MNRLFARLFTRRNNITLDATTFCDACTEVCTPACRWEAQRDHHLQAVYRNGLGRF